MSALTVTFTHRGWDGVCPIYVGAGPGGAPAFKARHVLLEWLFDVSEVFFMLINQIRCEHDPSGEPHVPVRICAKLARPFSETSEQLPPRS